MATLVLTVAGGLIGGPVGAAIGGLIGQAVDRDVLFKPKGREGPRLTELAVQTSSYGNPIPRLYGTMRVAGQVIWSTDLIESRKKSSGGKGQPSTTTYSYAASFAVLLSARPVASVGRIWADGNLLRGSAGDFKTSTTFRLHPGGEDQAADPLIASAEEMGLAPAHRGCAYAVFENLQLADFGNRIPSLTLEVTADPGAVATGAIAGDLAPVAATGATVPLAGFSAYGDRTRDVLDLLANATGGWFAAGPDGLTLATDGDAEVALVDDGYAAAGDKGARRTRAIAPIDTVPRAITLSYYDPAREYQTGLQRARRPGAGNREERIELPAVVSAGDAKAIAEAALARDETARERRTLALSWADLAVMPGARVAISGESGRWRVSGWPLEHKVLSVELVRLRSASASAGATSGRVVSAPDEAAGATILHAFELPALDDAVLTQPRLLIAANGTAPGWRKAALLYSMDEGASWEPAGGTGVPATIGTLASVPGSVGAALVDRRDAFDVQLLRPDMMLSDADARMLDRGANLALVGDELLQFGSAEPLGDGRWRLSELSRGRRGTETAIGRQSVGDRFVVVEADAVAVIDMPISALGGDVRLLASGVGDEDGPAGASALVTGTSVLPPSPVHLTATEASDGALSLTWVRRSRAGWRWIDGVDAPLAEEREAYRVTISAGDASRTAVVDAPELSITAAERGSTSLTVSVRQIGSNGDSMPATITVP